MDSKIVTLLVAAGGVSIYDAASSPDHLKFIFYQGLEDGPSLLIVGDAEKAATSCHAELLDIYMNHGNEVAEYNPDGAGEHKGGKFVSWGSRGFGISTPEELKPVIRQALGR